MHSEECNVTWELSVIRFSRLSRRTIYLLLLVIIFFGATTAEAQKAEINNLGVMNSNTALLLYFDLTHGFSKEVVEGIRNGIPATFNFQVVLSGNSKSTTRSPIVLKEFTRAVHYDSLKEEYRVESTERENASTVVNSFEKAKKMMSEVRDFSVAPLKSLTSGEEYVLKVRASLDERTLPMKVHYFVPFWKPWNVETDWYSLTFRFEPMDHE